MAYFGGLELLDIEQEHMRECKAFFWSGEGVWEYLDSQAKKIVKEDGYKLTMAQRQVYIFWKYIFKQIKVGNTDCTDSSYFQFYSGDGEISRRISLAIFSDRTRSGNVGNTMKAIKARMKKGAKK